MTPIQLFESGDSKGALEALKRLPLTDRQLTEVVNQIARINRLEKSRYDGKITFAEYTTRMNRINEGVILLINKVAGRATPKTTAISEDSSTSGLIATTQRLNKHVKRRNPELHRTGLALLNKLWEYEKKKLNDTSFDVVGRRFQVLSQEVEDYSSQILNLSDDELEAFVKKVNDLLFETVPSWDSIQEAYTLCKERKMNSGLLNHELKARPDSKETKIQCVEEIEFFLGTLQK